MTSPLRPGVCSLSGKCVTLNPKYFTTVCGYVCARVCVLGVAEYICDSPHTREAEIGRLSLGSLTS